MNPLQRLLDGAMTAAGMPLEKHGSKAELSRRSGVEDAIISNIFNRPRYVPDEDVRQKLAACLGISRTALDTAAAQTKGLQVMETPVQDEIKADDLLVCPACRAGTIAADFQVYAEVTAAGTGAVVRVSDGPDSDSFLSASCGNEDCSVGLRAPDGDGRLRKAELMSNLWDEYVWEDDVDADQDQHDRIRNGYLAAVEELLRRAR